MNFSIYDFTSFNQWIDKFLYDNLPPFWAVVVEMTIIGLVVLLFYALIGLFLAEASAWDGSVNVSYGSGYPWTPNDRFAKRQDPLLENSERLPSTFDVTLQFRRYINFYGQRLTLELQGWNLLNQDNPEGAGGGIFPGMNNATAAYGSYLTETGKFGGAFLQDQNGDTFNEFIPIYDPRVFAQHRTFRIGLGWRF